MSRVYITNFGAHDHSNASVYGEFVNITKGTLSMHKLDRLKLDIGEAIAESKPDDWLLLAGNSYISVTAALLWLAKHGVVKMLVHNIYERGKYREVTFSHNNISSVLEVTQ